MFFKLKNNLEYVTYYGEFEYNRFKNRYKDIMLCKY